MKLVRDTLQVKGYQTIEAETGEALNAHRHHIIAFAAQNRLPLMGQDRDFTEAGALLAYAADRRLGDMTMPVG